MRDDREILRARVRVPEHVVHREFPEESVVLNLETGMYHGLNPTAATMLEEVEKSVTVEAAVDGLAERFGQPRDRIESDLVDLCRSLLERGLIERDGAGD